LAEGGQIVNGGRLASALTRVALIGAMVGTWAIATSPAHAQEGTDGLIRVVHGLRGLVADVYLDGTLVLPTFQPERSTDPLPVPAGDHLIDIRGAGAGISSTPLLTQRVTVPAGFRGSLVAHLDASGKPTLSVFADDVTLVPAGRSRLVVRHAAATAGVDVLVDGQITFSNVAPAREASELVPAGRHEIEVDALTTGAVLAPPQSVEYPAGTAIFMYLIGSEADRTLGWAAVQVGNLQMAPERIDTGDGSTEPAPEQNRGVVLLVVIAGFGAMMTMMLVRWRSHSARSRRGTI
jgi:hypothetical protein